MKTRKFQKVLVPYQSVADQIFNAWASENIVKDKRAETSRYLMYDVYRTFCKCHGVESMRGQALRHRFAWLGIGWMGRGFRLRGVAYRTIQREVRS